MKPLDQQLHKLLKAAAQAPPTLTVTKHPSARWLLQQRQSRLQLTRNPYPLLRPALAAACTILTLTTLLNLHQIADSKRDVFNSANIALSQLLTP
ncbi:MAG: hypothetical protein ACO34E_02335 [Limisphaerales bacterium]